MHSIRKLKKEGAQVIDVDRSYLYRKHEASAASVDVSTVPEPPLIGWVSVEGPHSESVNELLIVTHGEPIFILEVNN